MTKPIKKTNKNSFYTLLVIPEHESKTKTYRFSVFLLRTIIFTLSLILLFFILFIVVNFNYLQKANIYDQLVEENRQLINENHKLRSLAYDIEKFRKYRETLNSFLNGKSTLNKEQFQDSLLNIDEYSTLNESQLTKVKINLFETIPSISPVKNPLISRVFENPKDDRAGHFGIDLVAKMGEPIVASASGVVILSTWTNEFGNCVIIDHANGYISHYKHNLSNLVIEGQKVNKGDIIALLGGTGTASTGNHCHFEIWYQSKVIDPYLLIGDFKIRN